MLALVASALVVGAGAGCSSFHREWKTAIASPGPVAGLQGCWDGQWKSEQTGHSGRLRCIVTPGADGRSQARFLANYWLGFLPLRFEYEVPLEVRSAGSRYEFRGSADLGKLAGGVYHYEGHADANRFFSTYKAESDYGTFEMRRGAGPGP